MEDKTPQQQTSVSQSQSSGLANEILGRSIDEYGEDHSSHILEQYKIYVQSAEQLSARRFTTTTTFFASANTLLLSGYGALASIKSSGAAKDQWLALIAVSGILLALTWRGLAKSFRDSRGVKHMVITELENLLPIKPFTAEWPAFRQIETRPYAPYTSIEVSVQWCFIAIYVTLLVVGIVSLFF